MRDEKGPGARVPFILHPSAFILNIECLVK